MLNYSLFACGDNHKKQKAKTRRRRVNKTVPPSPPIQRTMFHVVLCIGMYGNDDNTHIEGSSKPSRGTNEVRGEHAST